jgi:glycosyltransferase involved in cell wall biosynthesis
VPDLSDVMRQSDVFLLPSVEEGSALVTYEAQACGCVLVVSDATGARCEHLETGLVHAARDVDVLAEHLRMLDRDPALLARLRAATIARLDELSWARSAEEQAGVYAAALAGDLGPTPA